MMYGEGVMLICGRGYGVVAFLVWGRSRRGRRRRRRFSANAAASAGPSSPSHAPQQHNKTTGKLQDPLTLEIRGTEIQYK